ncbi:MAG: acetylxylan esterase, partial [Pirellula sp.]
DPLGELLSGHHASTAFELLGLKGLEAKELPAVNTPIGQGSIGYHLRQGDHDMLLYDWQQFMAFAKRQGF